MRSGRFPPRQARWGREAAPLRALGRGTEGEERRGLGEPRRSRPGPARGVRGGDPRPASGTGRGATAGGAGQPRVVPWGERVPEILPVTPSP